MQPVRSARLRPTQSPITAVNVWVKPARTPVRLERSAWEIPRRTSTRINAASAESVPRHAHTMRLPIWSARVRRVCPVDAITYDEYGVCVIDEKKCIQCGACIHCCPFGAIGSKTFMVDVIRLINAGKKVVAMVAPATEGQFGPDITHGKLENSFKEDWLCRYDRGWSGRRYDRGS